MFFRVNDFVNFRLHRKYSVLVIKLKKIKQQLINLFKIIKRINRLTYEFKLSINIKIHNVIFVTYLKFIINSRDDFYQRRRVLTLFFIIDDVKKFKIKRMLVKRRIRKKTE